MESLKTHERLIIAVLLIAGYYGIGAIAVIWVPEESVQKLSLTNQALNTLGPLLGAIVYALFQKPVTSAEGRSYEVGKDGSVESSKVVNTNADRPIINFGPDSEGGAGAPR